MTGAAKQLHLTQSAVSWKMKRLEERVGAALVVREGKELVLTDLGSELLTHADGLVSAHDLAVDSLQRSKLEGTIYLGMNDEPDTNDLALVLTRFKRRHPLIRLQVKMAKSEPIAKEIRAGHLDLGLIQTLKPLKSDKTLWTETLHWVCSHAFEHDAAEPLPLVTFGEDSMYMPAMLDDLRAAGIQHYSAFEADTTPGVHRAILAGFGVGVLHQRSLTSEFRQWSVPGLHSNLPEPVFVLRISDRNRSRAVRALVDEITASSL